MSISEGYTLLANYGLYAAGLVIVLLMLKRFNTVAQSGNVKRMATETAAPGLMLIVAVAVSGAAIAYALPRINAFVQSEQIVAAVEAGGVLAGAADRALAPVAPDAMGNAGVYTAQFPNGGFYSGFGSRAADASPTAAPTVAAPVVDGIQAVSNSTVGSGAAVEASYTVVRGDTLAKIAKRFYKDPNKWTVICNANRDVVSNCNSLRVGVVLTIPNADAGASEPYVAAQRPLVYSRNYQPAVSAPRIPFVEAMNTPTKAAPIAAPTVPAPMIFVEPTQMPLVLMAAADDAQVAEPTSMPLIFAAAAD